ncbi:hypothetical protein K0M31_015909 [Melipona bicolor]|uniref:Uncharacterized protein n=1 Tax=Melipona bicolor TaxID=60889 RepID=A0AA40G7B5_9HYME|nr:hypothetical protein K0M31_015909 [Melipona bicolor]
MSVQISSGSPVQREAPDVGGKKANDNQTQIRKALRGLAATATTTGQKNFPPVGPVGRMGEKRIKKWLGQIVRNHGHSSSVIPRDRKEKSWVGQTLRWASPRGRILSDNSKLVKFQAARRVGPRENSTGGKYSPLRTRRGISAMSTGDIPKYSHTSRYSSPTQLRDIYRSSIHRRNCERLSIPS